MPAGRRTAESEVMILQQVLDHINSLPRAMARKVHGSVYGSAGEPDVDACIDGRSVRVEVKRRGKVPEPVQYARLRKWEKAGALTGWVHSLEMLVELLTHLDDPSWENPQLRTSGPGFASDGRAGSGPAPDLHPGAMD